ncbi:DUF397 domain-containing protein [Streptomyces antibioticus]|uniref:DUF397 domain-containing protein n=1 Tax=Streptomyces antibioticus TaxID=1890 RepID=UPI00378B5174
MSVGPQPESEPSWSALLPEGLRMRDSKAPGYPSLTVSASAWAWFVDASRR